ncbi:hypothetical protein PG995_012118 [Apiospora arundinis]
MKFCTVLLFAVSATAGVLDLSFQKRRVTHDPEAATIEAPRALELAIKVRNANKKGGDDGNNIGAAANGTSVESSASNSTSIIDTRAAANSTSSSSQARGSAAAAAGSNSTLTNSKASAGNATNSLG